MSQNTSSAVMARRIEAHDSLDHFPTPPWATRALCEWLLALGETSGKRGVWEPACAEGHMSRALSEYFLAVHSTDVHDYGFGATRDFLWPGDEPAFDWIITNPPFRLAAQFALTALERSRRGVALLVRTAFLESAERHASLFSRNPPTDILQFCERVPMFKGRLDPKGSTATAYCWLVFRKGATPGTRFHWLPTCRKRLERPGDYPSEVLE